MFTIERPKAVYYSQIYVKEISLTDTILWSIDGKFCFTIIICKQKLNQSVDTSDCERIKVRSPKAWEAPFTIYSWTIRIMCYVIDTKICHLIMTLDMLNDDEQIKTLHDKPLLTVAICIATVRDALVRITD